jgi:hypothetical protein
VPAAHRLRCADDNTVGIDLTRDAIDAPFPSETKRPCGTDLCQRPFDADGGVLPMVAVGFACSMPTVASYVNVDFLAIARGPWLATPTTLTFGRRRCYGRQNLKLFL